MEQQNASSNNYLVNVLLFYKIIHTGVSSIPAFLNAPSAINDHNIKRVRGACWIL